MKNFLKIVLGFLLVIVIILASLYIAISMPKKVNVTWSEKDVQSYMQKAHVVIAAINDSSGTGGTDGSTSKQIKPASLDDLMFNNFISTGKIAVDDTVTSSEATAMINTVTRGQSLFKDVRMNFRDDGTIEASCYLGTAVDEIIKLAPQAEKYRNLIKQFEGKPIYWRYSLERVDDKKFDGQTLELRAGQIPIPLVVAEPGLKEAGSFLNDMVGKIDGFTCEQLSIDSQGFHFKGTLPEKLEYINTSNLPAKW